MNRSMKYLFIAIVFVMVFLSQMLPPASRVQSAVVGQTNKREVPLISPTIDSNIYLPLTMQMSCPSTSENTLQSGEVSTGSITAISEVDTYNFCGTAGDVIRLDMSRTSGSIFPAIDVYRPDGTLLCQASTIGSTVTIECTLDATGTFTILVGDRYSEYTGGYALYLQRLNNPGNPTPINFSDVVAASTTSIVERDTYTFNATSGDIIRLDMSRTSGSIFPAIDVYRPDGTLLCQESTIGSTVTIECTLDATGTFTTLVGDRYSEYTGGYSLSLNKLN